MNEIRRKMTAEGFTFEKTKGGHWKKVRHPNMEGFVIAPDTPGGWNCEKTLRCGVRRRMRLGLLPRGPAGEEKKAA